MSLNSLPTELDLPDDLPTNLDLPVGLPPDLDVLDSSMPESTVTLLEVTEAAIYISLGNLCKFVLTKQAHWFA